LRVAVERVTFGILERGPLDPPDGFEAVENE